MSGYATGSLSDTERKLLFEAALEDQDLFDQLAHEQALKDLIDQPGVRDRLIAGLAPAEASRDIGAWKKPLAWGFAAMFVVSMSVAALMLTRSGIRTQVAQRKIDEPPTAQTPQTENAPLSQPQALPAPPAPGSVVPTVPGSAAPPPAKQTRNRRSATSGNGRPDRVAAVRPRQNAPGKPLAVDGQPVADDKLDRARPGRNANSGASSSAGSIDTIRTA